MTGTALSDYHLYRPTPRNGIKLNRNVIADEL
jgi:hypothetical protein